MNDIYVLNDFHPFPEQLRNFALSQEFIDWSAPDGEVYKRICITEVPGLRPMLEGLFGPCDILGMGFRLNFNDELPNHAIHTDLGWGTHALVLYLSDHEPSGTRFWKHVPTGLDRIVEADRWMAQLNIFEWDKEDDWEVARDVQQEFNRAVIYKSELFHSRYPFKAYGTGAHNGRLIAIAFFTPENPA